MLQPPKIERPRYELLATGNWVRFEILRFAWPAAEKGGGKLYMARSGAFKDVDVMLSWRPKLAVPRSTDSW